MFSLEERTRAVELYVKYGRKAAPVIRELGYPCRVTLVAWYREWEAAGGGLGERSMARYTDGQKRAAVDHYLTHGRCGAFTRRELGYPGSWAKLAEWIDELAPGERRRTEPRTFTAAEKSAAVEAVAVRGEPVAEAAEAAGASRGSVYTWKKQLLPEEGGDMAGPAERPDVTALEARVRELEEQVRELEIRRDLAQGAIEILGKGRGGDPVNDLTNREKRALIDSLRGAWPLRDMLAAAGMARSSYHYQVAASKAPDRDAGAREAVREVFEESGGAYGRRRVADELRARGHAIGERRVARIMAEGEMVAAGTVKAKRRYCSYEGEISEHPGNRVGHDFHAALPNRLWLTDVTMFSIPAGRLYLSPVLDCFDGAIVSWTVSRSPDSAMANSMLEAALAQVPERDLPYLVVHSDCGCHYRWPGWLDICRGSGIRRSMSRKGCSPDNSRMEGWFGTMKTEMFHGRDWSGATLDDLEAAIHSYIGWHNSRRRKRSLGGMSPMEYRESMGLAA